VVDEDPWRRAPVEAGHDEDVRESVPELTQSGVVPGVRGAAQEQLESDASRPD